MTVLLLSLAAFASTLAGGLFALRFRERLSLILGFTAGVLLGVVAFDLLPEIFGLAHEHKLDAIHGMLALVAGFLVFHALEKFVLIHHGHEGAYALHHHPRVGLLSALALAGHSVLDGVGIGLAFKVSPSMGAVVSLAVIAHDFSDGLNTVSLMLVHQNTRRRAFTMLLVDAAAPVIGAVSTLFFDVPPYVLMLYLGFFAGFLLYIGASDILPEAHSQAKPGTAMVLIALTCAGAGFVLLISRLAA